jgi:hypothetical protein
MPTLGFLKKKRTKDSSGSKDLDSPASPIKESSGQNQQPGSIATSIPPSTSAASSSVPSSAVEKQPSAEFKQPPQQDPASAAPNSAAEPQDTPMTSAPSYPAPSQSPAGQHSQPSVQNMLNSGSSHANGDVTGALPTQQPSTTIRETKGKYALPDFNIQRTLGTGSFGRVHLVQSKHNQRYYAIKVLKKAQVVKMKQVEHTNDERKMLQKVKHPFLITLWGTFQDSKNLYMVMDFIEGGELFSLLRKSQVIIPLLIHVGIGC